MRRLRLGVNIDHVATLRNARGGRDPDPVRAALLAQGAGADGITAHLREDRRHIRDADIAAIMDAIAIPLNFEMAATPEMRDIALAHRPHAVCLVPERREERTTEGGLDVAGSNHLADMVPALAEHSRVSLFVAADPRQVEAAHAVGAAVVELHTGAYCDAVSDGHGTEAAAELDRLRAAAAQAHALGLEVHLGHGIAYDSVGPLAAIPEAVELNIGHFLIGEAVFRGLPAALAEMRARMDEARRGGAG